MTNFCVNIVGIIFGIIFMMGRTKKNPTVDFLQLCLPTVTRFLVVDQNSLKMEQEIKNISGRIQSLQEKIQALQKLERGHKR